MKQGARYPHRTGNPQAAVPRRTPLNPLSNEDRGLRLVRGELSPRSYVNHLLQHPGNRSVASPSTSNRRPRWRNAQRQEAPVCRNPETPPDHPGATQESSHTITEIDLASDQEQAERGGTAATDLQLESEQRAMQALYDYQHAARTAREADGQSVPLPSLQTYSDLPRMADGETCNFQQAN